MSSFYEDYVLRRFGRMRFMFDEWSKRLWVSIAGPADAARDAAEAATNANFVAHCPDDAVPHHGRASQLEPGLSETTAAYRLRIKDRWSFWANVGPKSVTVDGKTYGLQEALRFYSGCPGLYLYDLPNDAWLTGADAAQEDGNPENWSRFAIIVEGPHAWEELEIGEDFVIGPETLIGITMTSTELSRMRRTFRRHRPPSHVGIDIYIIFDATLASVLVTDRSAAVNFMRLPLGPRAAIGYLHHGQVIGDGMIIGQEFT